MIELENQELFLCPDEQPAKLIYKVNMNKWKGVRLKNIYMFITFHYLLTKILQPQ